MLIFANLIKSSSYYEKKFHLTDSEKCSTALARADYHNTVHVT